MSVNHWVWLTAVRERGAPVTTLLPPPLPPPTSDPPSFAPPSSTPPAQPAQPTHLLLPHFRATDVSSFVRVPAGSVTAWPLTHSPAFKRGFGVMGSEQGDSTVNGGRHPLSKDSRLHLFPSQDHLPPPPTSSTACHSFLFPLPLNLTVFFLLQSLAPCRSFLPCIRHE